MAAPSDPRDAWADRAALVAQQQAIGALDPPRWRPTDAAPVVAGVFVAFDRGEQGPGRSGDRATVGAALIGSDGALLAALTVPGRAGGPYEPGLLARREGPMMAVAVEALVDVAGRPEVLMVDASGRDHPRRCGLAVHLGWLLDLPCVGVTHRLLTGEDRDPPVGVHRRGWTAVVERGGEAVAAWLCTRDDVRPVAVHAGWRTDAGTAVEVALVTATRHRTPEPLRQARRVAREARARRSGEPSA